jgi:hypothetical protein
VRLGGMVISFARACVLSIVASKIFDYAERLVSPANAIRYAMREGGDRSASARVRANGNQAKS